MLAEAASIIEVARIVRPHESCVRIGGVSLALGSVSSDDVCLSRELEMFRDDSEAPDIEVHAEWAESLQPWRGEVVFDSGALWTLFRNGSEFIFDFTSPAFGPFPYKRLRTNNDFRSAQLILNHQALQHHHPVYPLEYPADELLLTNYLASNGLGVEVHGCGMVDAETGGHLLLGHSGAGKSTTTSLWKSLRDPQILSDDRIILRLHAWRAVDVRNALARGSRVCHAREIKNSPHLYYRARRAKSDHAHDPLSGGRRNICAVLSAVS